VRGDPQFWQKPRLTPGEELKYRGEPLVKRKVLRGTEIHVVIGEDVARRQLSQWQCNVQFGVP